MIKEKLKNALSLRRQWIIATVIGCFLFPVGFLWLLVLTVLEAKRSIQPNRTILHCGIGAIIWALFMSIPMLTFGQTDGSPMPLGAYIVYIGAALLGVYLLCVYGILSARDRKFRRCLLLVQQEHITSRALIGEIMGLSRRRTDGLLQRLIRRKLLDGASLRDGEDAIQFTKSVWAKQRVICRSCGADLVVDLGRTLICDYCGGALQPGFFQHVTADEPRA